MLTGDARWRHGGRRPTSAPAPCSRWSPRIAGWLLAPRAGIEPIAAPRVAPVARDDRCGRCATRRLRYRAGAGSDRSSAQHWIYRLALLGAAALVAVTGHLGGLLVWGADFLRP